MQLPVQARRPSAILPLNLDEIINKDDDDKNWADPGAPSCGMSHPGVSNHNDDREGGEHMQRSEKGSGKGKGTNERTGKMTATEHWK